jgi:hypothetical protein
MPVTANISALFSESPLATWRYYPTGTFVPTRQLREGERPRLTNLRLAQTHAA